MSDILVPVPEIIFGEMTQTEIEDFGKHSANYYTTVKNEEVLVIYLFPQYRIAYEIYSTCQEIPEFVMSKLNSCGYKIIYSDKKLSVDFTQLSESMRSNIIDMLFDKEFTYYAYP
jgi:hypothetical protein